MYSIINLIEHGVMIVGECEVIIYGEELEIRVLQIDHERRKIECDHVLLDIIY